MNVVRIKSSLKSCQNKHISKKAKINDNLEFGEGGNKKEKKDGEMLKGRAKRKEKQKEQKKTLRIICMKLVQWGYYSKCRTLS